MFGEYGLEYDLDDLESGSDSCKYSSPARVQERIRVRVILDYISSPALEMY